MPNAGTVTEPIIDKNELQRRLVFSVIVAGKNAKFAYRAIGLLFPDDRNPKRDFVWSIEHGCLRSRFKAASTGNYKKLTGFAYDFVKCELDLASCTASDLEKLHGVGPKTARFFLLWTRPNIRCAALDVHVLRWLSDQGYHDVPSQSPQSSKTYAKWEKVFLSEADRRGMTARELDYEIWSAANVGGIQ